MTTLLAPVKFRPVPPASVDIKKMNMSVSAWKVSIMVIPIKGAGAMSVTKPWHDAKGRRQEQPKLTVALLG